MKGRERKEQGEGGKRLNFYDDSGHIPLAD
jgi:hypothetical protein